jgi:UDP-N-acetylglucosamine--N-acetylmuramyl-(pentapeptide) pyrophosphoryl-undecaprenol N-acetylglucosamine transferase
LGIAGGGTGGHLFPGLAVAECALATGLASEVVFFGSQRGIESRLVPAAGYELVAEPITAVRGGRILSGAQALLRMLGAALRARAELRSRGIAALVGLGGYASAPAVLGARLAGLPVVLLEQNRAPGLANRAMAYLSSAVCTSFADTERWLPKGRARLTGNPVRPIMETLEQDRAPDMLLIFGGSAGAASLNRAVVQALDALAGEVSLPRVLHQAGARSLAEIEAAYADLRSKHAGLAVETVAFVDDMASAYRVARLAICRSGATSIAELIATATPAILLPYPHAAGDHQTANARALEEAGAAVAIPDDRDAADRLTEVLGRLLRNPEAIDSMAVKASSLRRPGAAQRVVDVVRAVVSGKA